MIDSVQINGSSGKAEIGLFVPTFILLSLVSLTPLSLNPVSILFLVFLLLFAESLGHPVSSSLVILTLAICAWRYVWPSGYPFFLGGPLVIYCFSTLVAPNHTLSRGWLLCGRLDKPILFQIALIGITSAMVLILWQRLLKPDLSLWTRSIPQWSSMWLMLLGIVFALFNALIEELVFRGILLRLLDATFGEHRLSVFIQSVPFALMHIQGVPSGWIGVGLTLVYGLLMGTIRRRAGGLLAPMIAHAVADVIVFALIFV